MKYLLLSLLLIGCISPQAEIRKTKEGIWFQSTKACIIKYKDSEVEAEFDSKSQPLINLNLPNLEIEK